MRGGRPTPGQPYVVYRDGESEEDISLEAYGTSSKTKYLLAANPSRPAKRKLCKGDVYIIPGERPAAKLTGRAADDLTVMVGGVELRLLACKITRTMDTGADGWSGRIVWQPGIEPHVDRVTRPYGYERCAVYIGNELQIAGCLYTVSPEMTEQGMTKELTGYSFTADAIDSSLPSTKEFSSVTLKQLADECCGRLGIKAHFEGGDWWKGAFSTVSAGEGESIFAFLSRLAAQRGGLVSCTAQGDMLFLRAITDQKPVGVLEEGDSLVPGWRATYDGRKRYHAYHCVTAGVKGRHKPPMLLTPGGGAPHPTSDAKVKSPVITEIDKSVPRSRFQTFRADDVTPGNVKNAARWRRNKQFVDALTLPFPVIGWLAPDGKPWTCNTTVTVRSATIGVPQGRPFIIRQVDFEYDTRGKTATLYLVPPEAYSGKDIGDIWYPQEADGGKSKGDALGRWTYNP